LNTEVYQFLIVSQPPSFVETPKAQEVIEGDDVVLEVSAIGKPLPELTWLRNGEIVETDGNIEVQSSEVFDDVLKAEGRLMIKDVNPEIHAGKWVIEATNDVGQVTYDARLLGRYFSTF
jgi:hypothetical protein